MFNDVIHLTKSKRNHWQRDYSVIIVPTDGLAPNGARPAAVTVMTDDQV